MVERHRVYTHPLAPRWPKTPPNYVGFRYDGHLQSIHHVEGWRIVHDIHEAVAGFPESAATGLFLAYGLGAPIRPTTPVRSRLPRDTRARAHIDLLLTSTTVREAALHTRAREAAERPLRIHEPAALEPVLLGDSPVE